SLPNVTLRIVDSKAGKEVMETHRTPDNRAATPTVILLDSTFTERGCWIERPRELQAKIAGEKKSDRDSTVFEGKMAWYDKDQGASTLAEFVEMLEKAARGEAACDAKPKDGVQ
ncbi:MAG: thioredoxin family protein, partial [Gemmatimonadaceae bacterium]